MSWINFSSYRKRIWNIEYRGSKIHLVFKHVYGSKWRRSNSFVEVTWSTSKFRGVKFNFLHPFDKDKYWPEVIFVNLRRSLAYGLNQNTREVTDRLLQVDPNKPHPIHKMVRTSKGL